MNRIEIATKLMGYAKEIVKCDKTVDVIKLIQKLEKYLHEIKVDDVSCK